MKEETRIVLERFQVRKSRKQKEAFWAWLCPLLREKGYEPEIRLAKGLVKSYNIVVGDPDAADVIFTAHYDTCAVLPLPNFITPRNLLWYLLYQLLLCLPMFLSAIAAEVVLLHLNAPFWSAIAAVYLVLGFCVWWVIDGRANRHTANDNTSGVMTLLELLLTLPEELRSKVCVVFFDNEEKGMFGSAGFAKQHKAVKRNKLLVNFDCVSDGDSIQLYPNRALKKESETLALLERAFLPQREKTVEVVRSFGFYPSDQRCFVRGAGVCALKKSRWFGYYMDKIHTRRDCAFDEKNIALLCAGAIRLAEQI